MAPMPAVKTVAELYPPRCVPEWWKFLLAVATTDRDDSGNFVLHRALTVAERKALQDRAAVLAPWFESGKSGKIMAAIVNMLVGFGGKSLSIEEARIVATQYTVTMSDLPLFAIERACIRFSNGEVRAEEVGAKHIDRTFPPSTAQLHIVAKEIARPFGEERTRIYMTLNGSPPKREPDPAEKKAIGEKLNGFAEEMRRTVAEEEDAKLVEARTRASAESKAHSRKMILREYEHRGLEPVSDANGNPHSISLLLSVGWRIEEMDGRNVLIKPVLSKREPQRTEGT